MKLEKILVIVQGGEQEFDVSEWGLDRAKVEDELDDDGRLVIEDVSHVFCDQEQHKLVCWDGPHVSYFAFGINYLMGAKPE